MVTTQPSTLREIIERGLTDLDTLSMEKLETLSVHMRDFLAKVKYYFQFILIQ